MELITVREIFAQPDAYMDKEVTVGGWIRSIRDSKTFGFIVLSDGTSFEPIQVVYHDTMENFAEISKCNVGTAHCKGNISCYTAGKAAIRDSGSDCYS